MILRNANQRIYATYHLKAIKMIYKYVV
jgi:hypothetical protein